MVAIARVEDGQDCVLPQKVAAPDEMPLTEVDAQIRHAKDAPIDEVPAFRKILRVTRLPLPLRRLIWSVGLNFGRQRANCFGSFGVTSVAAYGAGRTPCAEPGAVYPQLRRGGPDQTIDVVIRWDHRITDAALIAKALTRLEQVLNTRDRSRIAGKSAANRAKTGPGGRDLIYRTGKSPILSPNQGPKSAVSFDRTAFLPRNRLLAGRFRPALRFATRGPPQALGADLSAPGNSRRTGGRVSSKLKPIKRTR